MPFAFSICMAVRRKDTALRDQLNAVIARRRDNMDRILDEYGVPRLAIPKAVAKQEKD
jgi:mxaJ protein